MTRIEQLDYLIRYLSPESDIPKKENDKFRLFRSLINARKPYPISDEFLTVQDAFLQSEIKAKGITKLESLTPIIDNLYLWQGDITTLKVGAIVNAANSGMIGCFVPCHACIDNAIHTYAGVQLRLECAEIMRKQEHPEPTGKAKITVAYNLPSDYILHTVGAIIQDRVTDEDRRYLASCYTSCLELAKQNKIESVAFCCVSTGEFRFPNQEAAEIAIKTVTAYMNNNINIKSVIFNVFKDQDEKIYKKLLK